MEPGRPTVWLIRAGTGGRFASDLVAQGVIAIGWQDVGDVSELGRDQVVDRVRKCYGEDGAGRTAGQLYRFASKVAAGDLVVPASARASRASACSCALMPASGRCARDAARALSE